MKIALTFVVVACMACSSSDTQTAFSPSNPGNGPPTDAAPPSDRGPSIVGAIDASASEGSASGEDFIAKLSDFDCNRNSEWTVVGIATRYKNMLGHDAEMLAVARSATGGNYPVGTIAQLNPVEAMVKRRKGFDPTSNDWEFFTLEASDAGVAITNRGGGMSVSNARGTCLSCHLPSQSPFDLICGDPVEGGPTTTHGCVPLPVATSVLISRPDPKCM